MSIERQPFNPHERGLLIIYKENETNHCPGCGRCQWIIGRLTAECAFCSTAIPLEVSNRVDAPIIWRRGSKMKTRR